MKHRISKRKAVWEEKAFFYGQASLLGEKSWMLKGWDLSTVASLEKVV